MLKAQSKIILLVLINLFLIISIDIYSQRNFKNDISDDAFEAKLKFLTEAYPCAKIIISGDSRADRQIIPDLIKDSLKSEVINVSNGGLDLITIYNGLIRYKLLDSLHTIIITLSSVQINDGIGESNNVYISKASLNNTDILDKLKIMKLNYFYNLQRIFKNIFLKKIIANKLDINDALVNTRGFISVNTILDTNNNFELKNHSWYENLSYNGVRREQFIKTLNKFGENHYNIVFIQPPVAPLWCKIVKQYPDIDLFEKEFCTLIKNECSKYDKLIFLDYYNNPIPELTNDKFFNLQHLNYNGAVIFTNKIINILNNFKK